MGFLFKKYKKYIKILTFTIVLLFLITLVSSYGLNVLNVNLFLSTIVLTVDFLTTHFQSFLTILPLLFFLILVIWYKFWPLPCEFDLNIKGKSHFIKIEGHAHIDGKSNEVHITNNKSKNALSISCEIEGIYPQIILIKGVIKAGVLYDYSKNVIWSSERYTFNKAKITISNVDFAAFKAYSKKSKLGSMEIKVDSAEDVYFWEGKLVVINKLLNNRKIVCVVSFSNDESQGIFLDCRHNKNINVTVELDSNIKFTYSDKFVGLLIFSKQINININGDLKFYIDDKAAKLNIWTNGSNITIKDPESGNLYLGTRAKVELTGTSDVILKNVKTEIFKISNDNDDLYVFSIKGKVKNVLYNGKNLARQLRYWTLIDIILQFFLRSKIY